MSFRVLGVSTGSAETLWVDDDSRFGGNNPCYFSIQASVNAANESDTVIVRDGTYVDVEVGKKLTIRSEIMYRG